MIPSFLVTIQYYTAWHQIICHFLWNVPCIGRLKPLIYRNSSAIFNFATFVRTCRRVLILTAWFHINYSPWKINLIDWCLHSYVNWTTNLMEKVRHEYYTEFINKNSTDQRKFFRAVNQLLGHCEDVVYPPYVDLVSLANDFGTFFIKNIMDTHTKLDNNECDKDNQGLTFLYSNNQTWNQLVSKKWVFSYIYFFNFCRSST